VSIFGNRTIISPKSVKSTFTRLLREIDTDLSILRIFFYCFFDWRKNLSIYYVARQRNYLSLIVRKRKKMPKQEREETRNLLDNMISVRTSHARIMRRRRNIRIMKYKVPLKSYTLPLNPWQMQIQGLSFKAINLLALINFKTFHIISNFSSIIRRSRRDLTQRFRRN